MAIDADIARRKDDLDRELVSLIGESRFYGWLLHILALAGMIVAVGCSLIAGLAGVGELLSSKWVGVLALVPGAVAVLAMQFKLQEKSNWHFHRLYAAERLRGRLRYHLPPEPAVEDIARIDAERHDLVSYMQSEWVNKYAFDWTPFKPQESSHPPER